MRISTWFFVPLISTVLVAGIITVNGSALAGMNPNAQLALDCQARAKTRICGATYAGCEEINPVYSAYGDYDVIVVLYDFEGVRGLAYALDWTGVDGTEGWSFTNCTLLLISEERTPHVLHIQAAWRDCEFPPMPGGGVMVGWLRLFQGAGTVRIVPHWFDGLAVVDCDFQRDPMAMTHDGFVGGASPGPGYIGPCGGATATEEGTWGGIKSLYR